jgi:hypothetical protein
VTKAGKNVENSALEILFSKIVVNDPSEKDISKLRKFPDQDALAEFLIGKINDFLEEDKPTDYYHERERGVIAATFILGKMQTEVAIAPLVELLDIVSEYPDSEMYDAALFAIEDIGRSTLEPVYEKYSICRRDSTLAVAWVEILSAMGVKDRRIKKALLEYFSLDPSLAIQYMADYGDNSFLPLVEKYLDCVVEIINENKIDVFAKKAIVTEPLVGEYLDAREGLVMMKGTPIDSPTFDSEVEALDRRLLKHTNFRIYKKSARPSKSAAAKLGRNDPCPCGSGKKYKNCHGKE